MKRAFGVVSFIVFGTLIAYFLLSEPQGDQVSTAADSIESPEFDVLPPREVVDELTQSEAESPVIDTSRGAVGEANQKAEAVVSGGVPLEDMMRYVDGVELKSSIQVFEWLLTEEERDESWAIPMEAELHDYFRSLPSLANNYSVPYIHCLETMCGIQVIAYGQDGARNWIGAIGEMERRSWDWAEKLDTRVSLDEIESDVVGFVFYAMNITEEEVP